MAGVADAVVVGSALVDQIGGALDDAGRATPGLVEGVLERVRALAASVREAKRAAA
jgi:tryptophan synthase alpha chain